MAAWYEPILERNRIPDAAIRLVGVLKSSAIAVNTPDANRQHYEVPADFFGLAFVRTCFLNIAGMTNALVRFQRDVNAKTLTCEVWSYDGTGYNTQTDTINTLGNLSYGGGGLGGGAAASLGFLRVFTTLLPAGSRPPVTADHGDWTDFMFDGNLNDSSGHGHNGTGAATYMPTPNQAPEALPKTSGAPFWTNWTSLRAGFSAQLDRPNGAVTGMGRTNSEK